MRIQIPAHYFQSIKKLRLVLILLGGIFASNKLMTTVKSSTTPILLGLYAPNYLGIQSVIDNQLHQIDQWAGKRHSIAGFFIDIEDSNPAYNIPVPLERLYQNGYTAFINLKSTGTAAQIANGDKSTARKNLWLMLQLTFIKMHFFYNTNSP